MENSLYECVLTVTCLWPVNEPPRNEKNAPFTVRHTDVEISRLRCHKGTLIPKCNEI